MKIKKRNLRLLVDLSKRPIDSFERVVQRLHIRSPLDVENANLRLPYQFVDYETVTCVFSRVVQRTQNISVPSQHFAGIPAVPHMIAGRDDMNAEVEKLLCILL